MNPDWHTIREAYRQGRHSLRELASLHNVSFSTLGKRAVRERWALEREQFGNALATKVETSAMQAAEEKGRELGLSASAFVERSILEMERWLNRIEKLAEKGELDPDRLAKVIGAWRVVVETGRQAFRLDEKAEPEKLVRINILASAQVMPQGQPSNPPIDVGDSPRALPPTDSEGSGEE